MKNIPEVQALVDRMISFTADCVYDGYPTTSSADDCLVYEAAEKNGSDQIMLLACLASEYAETREQFENAQRFYQAFVKSCWDCNMIEAQNAIYEELTSQEFESV